MKATEYIDRLKVLLGGDISQEYIEGESRGNVDIHRGKFPRLYTNFKDGFLKFDFIGYNEIKIEYNIPSSFFLRLKHKTLLGKIIPFGIKLNIPEFDKEYAIQNTSRETAIKVFDDYCREKIKALEPFYLFEITNREYRLIKEAKINGDYCIEKGLEDITCLVEIVQHVKEIWNK